MNDIAPRPTPICPSPKRAPVARESSIRRWEATRGDGLSIEVGRSGCGGEDEGAGSGGGDGEEDDDAGSTSRRGKRSSASSVGTTSSARSEDREAVRPSGKATAT